MSDQCASFLWIWPLLNNFVFLVGGTPGLSHISGKKKSKNSDTWFFIRFSTVGIFLVNMASSEVGMGGGVCISLVRKNPITFYRFLFFWDVGDFALIILKIIYQNITKSGPFFSPKTCAMFWNVCKIDFPIFRYGKFCTPNS